MEAKQVAMIFSVVLTLIGLIDFASRLTVDNDVVDQKQVDADVGADKVLIDQTQLTLDEMGKLLAWSDVKAKVAEQPAVAVVAKPKPVAVAAVVAPPPDVRKTVAAAIAGDPSKQLLGDDLLTLKGIFYDGKEFASVEIENIHSKTKQYTTLAMGKPMADLHLVEIGKYHVVLKKQKQSVKLRLFK